MWKDVTGISKRRMLRGASGKLYSNPKLLTPSELADMLADGIQEVQQTTSQPTITLEQQKERRKRSINSERQSWLESKYAEVTISVSGQDVVFDADPASLNNVNGLLTIINAGGTLPVTFTYRSKDNVDYVLTTEELKALGGAMIQFVNDAYQTSFTLKNQIDAAQTEEELNAVDQNQKPVIAWPWPEEEIV